MNYSSSLSFPKNVDFRKRHNLQGPIDDAFMQPFICVRGTRKPWHQATQKYAEGELARFQRVWNKYLRGELPVKDDDELSEEDKLVVARARKIQRFLSQPFHVAEVFTGIPGKFVQVEDTVRSFKAVVNGEYDHLPEAAFYMVGGIEEAVAKAEKMAQEA